MAQLAYHWKRRLILAQPEVWRDLTIDASTKGKWEIYNCVNENYCEAATTTSQNINLSYGYLWWLNGKAKFIIYHSPS
jgi:hypothetical protein